MIDPRFGQYVGCSYCIHKTGPETCKAFPRGIPSIVQSGYWDHRKPFPDDSGITFSPKPNTTVGSLANINEDGSG
jgi:hypothetical protein